MKGIIPAITLLPALAVSAVLDGHEPGIIPSSRLTLDQAILNDRQVIDVHEITTPTAPQPTVLTTYWVETTLENSQTTWIGYTYTQTFAAVPEQWPAPGVGSIGLGTLTKTVAKRQEAQPTVYMIPVEMVLESRSVRAPLQHVQQVDIVQPVTVLSISMVDAVQTSATTFPPATQPLYSIIHSASVNEVTWANDTRPVGSAGRSVRGTASSGFLGTAPTRSANASRNSGFLANTRSVLFLHDGVPTASANATAAALDIAQARLSTNLTDSST